MHDIILWIIIYVAGCMLLRIAFDLITAPRAPKSTGQHGCARWGSGGDINQVGGFKPGGILLGVHPLSSKQVWYNGPGHILTVAGLRSGKGVSAILPNLLRARQNYFVIDPKGENAAICAGFFRTSDEDDRSVIAINPWAMHASCPHFLPAHRFNPLDDLDTTSDALFEDVRLIAQSLVMRKAEAGAAEHFNTKAEEVITGLLLYILFEETPENRHLPRLVDLIKLDPESWDELLGKMLDSKACDNGVSRAAGSMLRLQTDSPREWGSVIATVEKNLDFLQSPNIRRTLSGSDFSLANVMTSPRHMVFLMVRPEYLDTMGCFLRLVTGLAIRAKLRVAGQQQVRTTFILDEFASLGRMSLVETGMGAYAGYCIRFWPIVQDFSQLQDCYGSRWSTFLANAGAQQFFGIRDLNAAGYISGMLGSESFMIRQDSYNPQREASFSFQEVGRELMSDAEVLHMNPAREIVRMDHCLPLFLAKRPYYVKEDQIAAARAFPNPYYSEPEPKPAKTRCKSRWAFAR